MFLADEVIVLGVFVDEVGDDGADDVDFELLVAGVFEGGAGEGGGDSTAAQGDGNFSVPEGHPSAVVAIELEPGGLSVFGELKLASDDFDWVGHDGLSLSRL
jgi:hypothetical protein